MDKSEELSALVSLARLEDKGLVDDQWIKNTFKDPWARKLANALIEGRGTTELQMSKDDKTNLDAIRKLAGL